MAIDLQTRTAEEVAGLDALELAGALAPSRWSRVWAGLWPKLAAVAIALGLWQLVAMSGWRPDYSLPGPGPVIEQLGALVREGDFWHAVVTTMRRGVVGFVLAVAVGTAIGVAVARVRPLRAAVGSLITGLQTMPSIAWFPLAIVLFQLSERAILFVVVLGAAPSIANGLITGVDYVPPILLRAGRNLGARGWRLYRYVILPASLPSFVAGLKQGWAFAWRSLMAGELLVIIAERPSIGARLAFAREFADVPALIAFMIVILAIGLLVDAAFTAVNENIRRRWGVVDGAA